MSAKKFVVTNFQDTDLLIYIEVLDETKNDYVTGTYVRSKIEGKTLRDNVMKRKRWPRATTQVELLSDSAQQKLGHYVYYKEDADAP